MLDNTKPLCSIVNKLNMLENDMEVIALIPEESELLLKNFNHGCTELKFLDETINICKVKVDNKELYMLVEPKQSYLFKIDYIYH